MNHVHAAVERNIKIWLPILARNGSVKSLRKTLYPKMRYYIIRRLTQQRNSIVVDLRL